MTPLLRKKTKYLIIVGASGFGREVAWLVERINSIRPFWKILGFLDDNEDLIGKSINGYKVIDTLCNANLYSNAYFVCTIGSSEIRKCVIEKLGDVSFATLTDPSVVMSKSVDIGEGTIICSNTIITTNVKIGKHVIINLSCTIGHDSQLEDFVTFYPSLNASGNSVYGSCAEIGTGTQIIQGKIGAATIVGVGSVVVKDLPENCTAVGVPCKPIKFNGDRND